MQQVVNCQNCGAPMAVSPDGSLPGCTYCGVGRPRTIDPMSLAHSLKQGSENVAAYLERLAETLEAAFPGMAQVERKGFISKQVSSICVEVKNHQYKLAVENGKPAAHRSQHVRGVRLRDEHMALHHWIEELSRGLADLASENDQAREALSKFVR